MSFLLAFQFEMLQFADEHKLFVLSFLEEINKKKWTKKDIIFILSETLI